MKDAAYYRDYREKKKVATMQPNATATGEVATEIKKGLQPGGSFILSDGQVWHPYIPPVKAAPIKSKGLAAKMVDPSWRSLIEYLAANLRHDYAEDVRIGCYGPTIAELKPLLTSIPLPG